MNKPKQIWKPFHKPIASTDEVMSSLEPYETRKMTEAPYFNRFTDQEKRYYVEHEEKERLQASLNQKRQMQTLSNPEEAIKINRLRHELSDSKFLTEV